MYYGLRSEVMDASNPVYFIVGVIVIGYFLYWSANQDKKKIDKGQGDDLTEPGTWGFQQPTTYKQSYSGTKIIFWIFIVVAVISFLSNF